MLRPIVRHSLLGFGPLRRQGVGSQYGHTASVLTPDPFFFPTTAWPNTQAGHSAPSVGQTRYSSGVRSITDSRRAWWDAYRLPTTISTAVLIEMLLQSVSESVGGKDEN